MHGIMERREKKKGKNERKSKGKQGYVLLSRGKSKRKERIIKEGER